MEQNTKRRLGNSPKSNSWVNNHPTKVKTTRLRKFVGGLHNTKPIYLWTAKYATRTLSGVRGALRQSLAEPPTRLPAGVLVHRVSKPLSLLSFSVFVVLDCVSGVLIFFEGEEKIFWNSSCVGTGTLLPHFWSAGGIVRMRYVCDCSVGIICLR